MGGALRALFCLWLLASCAKHRVDPDDAARAALMERADAAWTRRGADGLDAVDTLLLSAPSHWTQHPDLLWRRARVSVARGMVAEDPAQARRHHAQARALALGCVLVVPYGEGRGDDDVVLSLPGLRADRVPCAAYAAFAWARWADDRDGEVTALDSAAVDALTNAVPPGTPHEDIALWAGGLWHLGHDPSPGMSGALLVALSTRLPDFAWVAWADAARRMRTPPTLRPAQPPTAPEDVGVLTQTGLLAAATGSGGPNTQRQEPKSEAPGP